MLIVNFAKISHILSLILAVSVAKIELNTKRKVIFGTETIDKPQLETSYLSVSHFDCQISKSYWCKFIRIIVTICTSLLFLVWCNSRKLCDITDSCSWVKELLCCNQRALHKLLIPLIFCEALFICLKRIFGFHDNSANA